MWPDLFLQRLQNRLVCAATRRLPFTNLHHRLRFRRLTTQGATSISSRYTKGGIEYLLRLSGKRKFAISLLLLPHSCPDDPHMPYIHLLLACTTPHARHRARSRECYLLCMCVAIRTSLSNCPRACCEVLRRMSHHGGLDSVAISLQRSLH